MHITLQSGQAAMLKRGSSFPWNTPFVVETITEIPGNADDYYGSPTLATGTTIMSGSWTWRPQDRRTGSEGGVFSKADLVLATDILNSGTIARPKTHLVVDGIRCTITTVTTNPELGEIVVGAIRAQ